MMNENFLVYLWTYQLLSQPMFTTEGEEVTVISPGHRNLDSGPDFFDGRIKIGQTLWAGNIEIHVKSSDWVRHGHHQDNAYNNIILHVVYTDDKPVSRSEGDTIPTVVLANQFNPGLFDRYQDFLATMTAVPCNKHLHHVNHFTVMTWFDNLMIERLEQKTAGFTDGLIAANNDFNEAFYRKLCRNFGFNTNSDAMEQLAISLPLNILSKHQNDLLQLEALLFGQAGFLDKRFKDNYPRDLVKEYGFLKSKYQLKKMDNKVWKFMRMRPANFPTIRIAQFAALLHKIPGLLHFLPDTEKLSHVQSLLKIKASAYWDNHYHFDQVTEPTRQKWLGDSSANLLIINTIVPFVFMHNRYRNQNANHELLLDWMEHLPSEKNAVSQLFSSFGLQPKSALESQAMIQLKTQYCDKKRCLECRIGHELLGR